MKKITLFLALVGLVTFSAWAVTVYWFSAAPQVVTLATDDIFLIERPSPHTNMHVTAQGIMDGMKTFTGWPAAVGAQGITFSGGQSLTNLGTNVVLSGGNMQIGDSWITYDSAQRTAGFGLDNSHNSNTWFGVDALKNNTGANSCGFGFRALTNNTGVSANGFGYLALYNNIGAYSCGFGQQTLSGNTGANSSGFGHQALYNNSGANSTGFGYAALSGNSGPDSTGFGYAALSGNSGTGSSGIGYNALFNNSGANASGLGDQALYGNTGANVSGIGYNALFNNTGANSSGFGHQALYGNTGANVNGFGYAALYANGPGTLNTGVGYQCGQSVRSAFLVTFATAQAFTGVGYSNVTALNVGAGHGLVTNTLINISHSTRSRINGDKIVIATNDTQVVISNVFIATFSGRVNWGMAAQNNLYLGDNSASNVIHSVGSVYIGSGSGPGTANTLETNKLYIANAPGEPLIGGDFGTRRVSFNGSLWVRAISQASTNFVPDSDTVTLYSVLDGSGVAGLWVMNEAGTRTLISPHAKDAPEWLYDANDPDPQITCELQMFLGRVRWHNKTREADLKQREWGGEDIKALEKSARTVIFIESFADFNARTGESLSALDWETVQAERQAVYEAKLAAAAEPTPAPAKEVEEGEALKAPTVEVQAVIAPAQDIRKPMPAWLENALLAK